MEKRGWHAARIWHLVTALVTLATLFTQTGQTVLSEDPLQPNVGIRLFDMFSYFTIQSNLLVLLAVTALAVNPGRGGVWWRALRATSIVGITVTGVVHWFLLRPLATLTGLDYWTDKFLHVVVPLLAVVGWLLFGPRPRLGLRTIGLALVWPICWLVVTLVRGAIIDWYPYPFLDVTALGAAPVVVMCVLLTIAVVGLLGLMGLADRFLPTAPSRAITREPPKHVLEDAP